METELQYCRYCTVPFSADADVCSECLEPQSPKKQREMSRLVRVFAAAITSVFLPALGLWYSGRAVYGVASCLVILFLYALTFLGSGANASILFVAALTVHIFSILASMVLALIPQSVNQRIRQKSRRSTILRKLRLPAEYPSTQTETPKIDWNSLQIGVGIYLLTSFVVYFVLHKQSLQELPRSYFLPILAGVPCLFGAIYLSCVTRENFVLTGLIYSSVGPAMYLCTIGVFHLLNADYAQILVTISIWQVGSAVVTLLTAAITQLIARMINAY